MDSGFGIKDNLAATYLLLYYFSFYLLVFYFHKTETYWKELQKKSFRN